MREERLRQVIRLKLLALVLALALTWYALNPAPGSITAIKRDEGQPDEKRREAKSPSQLSCEPLWTVGTTTESALDPFSSASEKIDALEWPEVIDVR